MFILMLVYLTGVGGDGGGVVDGGSSAVVQEAV